MAAYCLGKATDRQFSPASFDINRLAFLVPATRTEGFAGLTAIDSAFPPKGPVGIQWLGEATANQGRAIQIAPAATLRCKNSRILDEDVRTTKPLWKLSLAKVVSNQIAIGTFWYSSADKWLLRWA